MNRSTFLLPLLLATFVEAGPLPSTQPAAVFHSLADMLDAVPADMKPQPGETSLHTQARQKWLDENTPGKLFESHAIVHDVTSEANAYLSLPIPNSTNRIRVDAQFPKSSGEQIAKLKKGQAITIRGVIISTDFRNQISIRDASIVESEGQPATQPATKPAKHTYETSREILAAVPRELTERPGHHLTTLQSQERSEWIKSNIAGCNFRSRLRLVSVSRGTQTISCAFEGMESQVSVQIPLANEAMANKWKAGKSLLVSGEIKQVYPMMENAKKVVVEIELINGSVQE